jgi:hypothetical protein
MKSRVTALRHLKRDLMRVDSTWFGGWHYHTECSYNDDDCQA